MAATRNSLTYYRQRDDAWALDILGFNAPGSEYTIGNYGCLITALGALCATDPHGMNEAGKTRKCFAPGSGIANTFEPRRWVSTARWKVAYISEPYKRAAFPLTEYSRLMQHLANDGVAICEVQWPVTKEQHFVLAIAAPIKSSGQVVIIADPERQGQIEELERFYKRWDVALVRSILYTEVA